jgi:hypothetical protein
MIFMGICSEAPVVLFGSRFESGIVLYSVLRGSFCSLSLPLKLS